MNHKSYDIVIIGGGINGTAIARDAAGRGLTVLLVEMNDLASATSSKSTKLIHGGLRYLEYYEFLLVRSSLIEREILLKNAPHIIQPLRFILPHAPHLRPRLLIRLGLFLYDHLTFKRSLPASGAYKPGADSPLKENFTHAFSYYDCRVDDARFVIENALDAKEKGAEILPRTRFEGATRQGDHWLVQLQDNRDVQARLLINAAGPWVSDIIENKLSLATKNRLRLVKGSHIITKKLYAGDDAHLLQLEDGRIIFTIPYEENFTLIGTTEVNFKGDPSEAAIGEKEIEYLCRHVSACFKKEITPADVVSHYAGIRPLYDDATEDAKAVTRDYVLALNEDAAPLLSIFGGKITTCRHLAEKVMEKCEKFFPHMGQSWTAEALLPGGGTVTAYPWLGDVLRRRYERLYGSRLSLLLEGAEKMDDLGDEIGPGLFEREVRFLMTEEWAVSAEDILWRRTKLGLHWSEWDVEKLESWLTLSRRTARAR